MRDCSYISVMEAEITFCDIRRREVINGSDGRRLGHVTDIVFGIESGKVSGVILPYGKRGMFGKSQDLFVPWSCVQKIGEDVILVEIIDLTTGAPKCVPASSSKCLPEPPSPPPAPKKRNERDCDGKCEKCMLFDCSHRWETVRDC